MHCVPSTTIPFRLATTTWKLYSTEFAKCVRVFEIAQEYVYDIKIQSLGVVKMQISCGHCSGSFICAVHTMYTFYVKWTC